MGRQKVAWKGETTMADADRPDTNGPETRFLSGLTHELRTPLGSILMLAELLGANRSGTLDAKNLGTYRQDPAGGVGRSRPDRRSRIPEPDQRRPGDSVSPGRVATAASPTARAESSPRGGGKTASPESEFRGRSAGDPGDRRPAAGAAPRHIWSTTPFERRRPESSWIELGQIILWRSGDPGP